MYFELLLEDLAKGLCYVNIYPNSIFPCSLLFWLFPLPPSLSRRLASRTSSVRRLSRLLSEAAARRATIGRQRVSKNERTHEKWLRTQSISIAQAGFQPLLAKPTLEQPACCFLSNLLKDSKKWPSTCLPKIAKHLIQRRSAERPSD